MKATVIICTHNRAQLLFDAIASLNNAVTPQELDISILVIANACSDDTVSKLIDYQKNQSKITLIRLEYVEEFKAGKSFALNTALTKVNSGWLCFIDDDQKVDKNYFSALSLAIQSHPKTTIFCGKLIPDWPGNEPSWVHDNGPYKIRPIPFPQFDLGVSEVEITNDTPHPQGGNLIAHNEVFNRVGNFSEDLGPIKHNLMGSEDSDFIQRAINSGERLTYIPELIQFHYVDLSRLNLFYLIKKSFQRNRSVTLTTLKQNSHIPKYLWLKLFKYTLGVMFCMNIKAIRFYLTKIAGICGQITGRLQSR